MKLLEAPKGLIINLNCLNIFNKGQKTFVNDFYRYLEDYYFKQHAPINIAFINSTELDRRIKKILKNTVH